ncbi:MAG: amidohydrolase family protein [Candidatus Heimdallarchaeota archaeon]
MIKNASFILTMKSPVREIIKNGSILIDNGAIVQLGKASEIRESADIHIDAKGMIALPGLINTHVHLAQAMIRGCADDQGLIPWLRDYVWPLQGNYSAEDGKTSAQLCMIEMIKSGTTSFVESMIASRYGMDEIAKALHEIGMRGALSKIVMDDFAYGTQKSIMHEGMIEDRQETIQEFRQMYARWHKKNDQIFIWLGPRSLGACTPDLYREIAELAKECMTGVTMHLAEVKEDVTYTIEHFGLKPAEFMKDVGLLGPNILFTHAIWLSDREIEILGQSHTNVTHCPASNMKLASGIAKVPRLLKEGINVTIGTDGGPSNNTYDMLREMRLTSYLQKVRTLNPTVLPAESVLEMATIRGAKVLGLEEKIGSIEIGKRADLILVKFADKPHLTPMYNPVSSLVYAACGSDVDTTLIDGQVIMRARKLQTIDELKVLEKAQKRGIGVTEKAGIEITSRWPTL